MQTVLTIDLIAADPAIRNGRPCIAGTGLRVTDLVMAHLFTAARPTKLPPTTSWRYRKCTLPWPTTTSTKKIWIPTSGPRFVWPGG